MCGIVGYIGDRNAKDIIINGLKRLEYRGYDSAGLSVLDKDGDLINIKTKGKVLDLENKIDSKVFSNIGIGHTRWATHGIPSDINAHPHFSNSGNISIVHNGIIENYAAIKNLLLKKGFTLKSNTDTEVLVNFIEYVKNDKKLDLVEALRISLNEVIGAYAIAILDKENTNKIITARLGSPLVVGIGKGEFFIGSDATPFIEYTNNVVYLDDGEIGIIERGKDFIVKKIKDNRDINPNIQELTLTIDSIEKGGFETFMRKEIHEQPDAIFNTFRGRLLHNEGQIRMQGLDDYKEKFRNANRIVIIACGTSWHAGLLGEYIIENLARINVEVEYASEYRYRNPIIGDSDIVIPISQSGETADTLSAVKMAKEKGAFIFSVCNVVGSSIARESHAGAYTHAGPEIGVASTKAFTSQLTILYLISLYISDLKGSIDKESYYRYLNELNIIPQKIKEVLEIEEKIKIISKKYKDFENFLYLGRGYNFPVALEGALKLKEISYIHAEGYPAAEMKHGPIALIDENMPVVIIATKNKDYEKIVSNCQEIKSRKGKLIIVTDVEDTEIQELADDIILVPSVNEIFSPIINVIPLQYLSYHIAVMRGCNVDQPRNLAKSVTVE